MAHGENAEYHNRDLWKPRGRCWPHSAENKRLIRRINRRNDACELRSLKKTPIEDLYVSQ